MLNAGTQIMALEMNIPKDHCSSTPALSSLEDAMEQYQASLLRYTTRVQNNEDAAQDVVLEIFIRLNGNLEKIRTRGGAGEGEAFQNPAQGRRRLYP